MCRRNERGTAAIRTVSAMNVDGDSNQVSILAQKSMPPPVISRFLPPNCSRFHLQVPSSSYKTLIRHLGSSIDEDVDI